MGLEIITDTLSHIANHVRDYFAVPDQLSDMRKYAIRNYLPGNLLNGKSEEEKNKIYAALEEKIKAHVDSHQHNLDRLGVKAGQLTGIAALINDAYHFYRGTPFSDFGLVQLSLVGGKALLELPAMYHHVTETGDLYGAVEWMASKAMAWLIPVIGPGLDYNVAARIIKRNAIANGARDFMKEYSQEMNPAAVKEKRYKPRNWYETVYNHMQNNFGHVLKAPQPAYAASHAAYFAPA